MRWSGCLRGELEEADRAVGAADAKHAIAVLDVGDGRLQFRAAQLLRLLHRALGRHVHRRAADEQRARAGAAEAGAAVGVAQHDADALDRHAEHVDGQLREGGGDALPHGLRRGEDFDLAVALDRHRDAFR